jgi:hypothetical protein
MSTNDEEEIKKRNISEYMELQNNFYSLSRKQRFKKNPARYLHEKRNTKVLLNEINVTDISGNVISKKKETFIIIILPIICCVLLIILVIGSLAGFLGLFKITLFRNIILVLIGISAIMIILNILVSKRTSKLSK